MRNMTQSSRQKEYLAIRIASASPIELVCLLYEGAVQSVETAIRALHSGDILSRGRAINKAIEILAELRMSLRRDVEEQYSNTLAELYGYIQHQLIRAHAEQSESLLQEASRLLRTLLEGWSGAVEKSIAVPVTASSNEISPAANPVAIGNPYSPPPPGLRLESRTWQL
jgi:flagellar secretion chaperone FliS